VYAVAWEVFDGVCETIDAGDFGANESDDIEDEEKEAIGG
jgi:hypothetical protein